MDIDVSPSSGFSQIYNSLNNSVASVNPLVLLALTLIIVFYFLVNKTNCKALLVASPAAQDFLGPALGACL